VRQPSRAKSQRHPSIPLRPPMCRKPKARKADTILVNWYENQK
jgi:hypothetical protein